MSIGYALAYRVGVTPWERAGAAATEQFARLLDREEAGRPRPPGRAVDLGCGTGQHTIELAERGWDAVGIDNVTTAIDKARARPGPSGSVRFATADVTRLQQTDTGAGIDFWLDVGCFHGLDDTRRHRYGLQISTLSAPEATLLMLCFRPGRRIGLPRGASATQIERALPTWTIIDQEDADTTGMPGPLKHTRPQWYRLQHH